MTQITHPKIEKNSLMSFYVIWKERSSEGIKQKQINCVDERDAENKLRKLNDLRYVFGAKKIRSDSVDI